MVQFGSDMGGYTMPMDRESDHDHQGHSHGFATDPDATSTNDIGIGMGDLGMSMGLGPIPNVHAVQAKLRPGTKKLEFVFTGFGKGSGQGQTPGQYGFKQRQALIEMGKANKIDFTTHSTVGVYGLAGMGQGGNFSKESQDASLQEVKRAIEFAADVAGGGPVVVHTGEFSRSTHIDWNTKGKWKGKFQLYQDEGEEAMFTVIDRRTGGVLAKERKNREVVRPKWLIAKPGDEYFDREGNKQHGVKGKKVFVDYFGKEVANLGERVPEYSKVKDEFLTENMQWDDLEEEAGALTEEAQKTWKKLKAQGLSGEKFREAMEKTPWSRFKDMTLKEVEVKPEEAWVIAGFQTNMANSKGWAKYYGNSFQSSFEQIQKLKEQVPILKEIYDNALKIKKETGNEEAFLKATVDVTPQHIRAVGHPSERIARYEEVEKQIEQLKRQMDQAHQSASSQWAQARNSEEQIKAVESAETYAVREGAKAYAEAAIFAMRHTQKLQKQGRKKKSLQIALENLFPGSYGSHPEELMILVDKSRDLMINKLTKSKKEGGQFGYSEEKARGYAVDHINTTLDVGHLNMWRKHWKTNPEKTIKQNEQDFNKWSLDMVGKMVKKKMVGHVHINDNYGYHDDHLAPGEGNTPIKGMLQVLKKNGYDGEIIVEPGADYYTDPSRNGFKAVEKAWRHLGIPAYGAASGIASQGKNWNQIGNYWVGDNTPPYFVFGGYAPSEEWKFWSGVPLE